MNSYIKTLMSNGNQILPRTRSKAVTFDDGETFQQKYDNGELTGADGKSAYQQAVEAGYTGTEAEFALILSKAVTKDYVDERFNDIQTDWIEF